MPEYVLDLKDLEQGKVSFGGVSNPGELDFGAENVRQATPMRWQAVAERAGEEIRITGSLEVVMEMGCSRCLEPARCELSRNFDLYFRETDEHLVDEEEIELNEEDTRTAFFSGTQLMLGEVLREQALLALPMKALCSAECKGLCPVCGANLNQTTCHCSQERFSPHMDQLAEIKRKLEERSS